MSKSKTVQKVVEEIFARLGWVRRRLAGNTYDKVASDLLDLYKETSGEIEPEDILDREFIKVHDGEGYRIRFEKP